MKASALFVLALAAAALEKPEEQSAADKFHANAEESDLQDALSTPFACYSEGDDGYIGLASTTASGKQCQNWMDKFPVKISKADMPPSNQKFRDHNYCRQLESGKQPVCFPLSGAEDSRPEACDVAKCPADDTVSNMNAARDEMNVALGDQSPADMTADDTCKCADALFGSSTSMSDTTVGFIQTGTRTGVRRADGTCDCN